MRPNFFARKVVLRVNALTVAALYQKNLPIVHVRLAENHVLFVLVHNVATVPNHVDIAGRDFSFLVVPVNRAEFKFDAHTLSRLFCKVNVKADDFTRLIFKTHWRKFIIDTDDKNFFINASGILLSLITAATAHRQHYQQK